MQKAVAKLIAKISEITILLNFKTKHHAFLDIAGHVSSLTLKIYLEGWSKGKGADYEYNIYYWDKDNNISVVDILDNLSKIIDLLESLIKEG